MKKGRSFMGIFAGFMVATILCITAACHAEDDASYIYWQVSMHWDEAATGFELHEKYNGVDTRRPNYESYVGDAMKIYEYTAADPFGDVICHSFLPDDVILIPSDVEEGVLFYIQSLSAAVRSVGGNPQSNDVEAYTVYWKHEDGEITEVITVRSENLARIVRYQDGYVYYIIRDEYSSSDKYKLLRINESGVPQMFYGKDYAADMYPIVNNEGNVYFVYSAYGGGHIYSCEPDGEIEVVFDVADLDGYDSISPAIAFENENSILFWARKDIYAMPMIESYVWPGSQVPQYIEYVLMRYDISTGEACIFTDEEGEILSIKNQCPGPVMVYDNELKILFYYVRDLNPALMDLYGNDPIAYGYYRIQRIGFSDGSYWPIYQTNAYGGGSVEFYGFPCVEYIDPPHFMLILQKKN